MAKVVGISFQRGARIYDFDAGDFALNAGEQVIVDTEQGCALGHVVRPPRERLEPAPGDQAPALKSVIRLASSEDLEQHKSNLTLEKEAQSFCRERISTRRLDMSLVKVECLFDRTKMIFYFTAESRQDFRELVKDLVARFRTRVEMRQIGVRHEAKLLGGLGSCGRELCCTTFLRDFEPVSVKMAKEQNLSLNPTKISGLCGRLMCCLTYEFETYKSLRQGMPKLGKRLRTPSGDELKVIRLNVLERLVTVINLADGQEESMSPEELSERLNLSPNSEPPMDDSGDEGQEPAPQDDSASSGDSRSRSRKKRSRKSNR